jgi:hypothetical protein
MSQTSDHDHITLSGTATNLRTVCQVDTNSVLLFITCAVVLRSCSVILVLDRDSNFVGFWGGLTSATRVW